MGLFSSRSFNVKLVNDKMMASDGGTEPRDATEGVLTAAAYSQIAVETLSDVAKLVTVTTVTIIAAKTASNVVNAGLKYLTK